MATICSQVHTKKPFVYNGKLPFVTVRPINCSSSPEFIHLNIALCRKVRTLEYLTLDYT